MKFGDKLKDLRKQAQDAVAENRDKIHEAVDAVSTTVDQKTGGKHTDKIAKFGEQAGAAVDRFSSEGDDEAGGDPSAPAGSSPHAPSGATETPPPASGGSTPPAGGDPYGGTPPAFDE